MAGSNYFYCPVCDSKALYDADEYGETPDVVVLHSKCLERDRAERERAVREQAAQELYAWADAEGSQLSGVGLTGPLAARRRTLHAAARKIAPEPTEDEMREALAGLLSGHGPARP